MFIAYSVVKENKEDIEIPSSRYLSQESSVTNNNYKRHRLKTTNPIVFLKCFSFGLTFLCNKTTPKSVNNKEVSKSIAESRWFSLATPFNLFTICVIYATAFDFIHSTRNPIEKVNASPSPNEYQTKIQVGKSLDETKSSSSVKYYGNVDDLNKLASKKIGTWYQMLR